MREKVQAKETCGCVLVDGVNWLSDGEVQEVEAAGRCGGWGGLGYHHKACDWVLQPQLGERSTLHRGKEAEPQATGETESVSVK